jgi:hypothetical protein
MQKSQSPDRIVDPMQRAQESAKNAENNLWNLPESRTNGMHNKLDWCSLNTRCQQVWNGNIQIWWINNWEWFWWNNPQNHINKAKSYVNQNGNSSHWPWAENISWRIW